MRPVQKTFNQKPRPLKAEEEMMFKRLTVLTVVVMATVNCESPRRRTTTEGVWPPLDVRTFETCKEDACHLPNTGFVFNSTPLEGGGADLVYGPVTDHESFLMVCARPNNEATDEWTAVAYTDKVSSGHSVAIRGTDYGDRIVWAEKAVSCLSPDGTGSYDVGGVPPTSWGKNIALVGGNGGDTIEDLPRSDFDIEIATIIDGGDGDDDISTPEGDACHTVLIGGQGNDTVADRTTGISYVTEEWPGQATRQFPAGDNTVVVTHSSWLMVIAQSGNNTIDTSRTDGRARIMISSLSGNRNVVTTGNGPDMLFDGDGDVVANLGNGMNWFEGRGGGLDDITTGSDSDLVIGGTRRTVAHLGGGDDQAYGGQGTLEAHGEAGNDTLLGNTLPGCMIGIGFRLDETSTRWPDDCVVETGYVEGTDDTDIVDGGAGIDICDAEEMTDCESELCADGWCEYGAGEDCETCPEDCGACPYCGDTYCDEWWYSPETCTTCPADCGECPDVCGDGLCNGAESCATCEEDCGICPYCGDGDCYLHETCTSCPDDCGECPPGCGNGICSDTESCATCPEDCEECPTVCGDDICNDGESCSTCPDDCDECPLTCGDGHCSESDTE
ncbi:hypothetical protein COY93_04510, partial [Candidatus Uhrbacteria bacterium CG_4_10_14_0_8_um_filter_58_22]